MSSHTMLTRTLRRTLFDSRYSLPPTFLLPWTAGLHSSASTCAELPSLPAEPSPSPSSSNGSTEITYDIFGRQLKRGVVQAVSQPEPVEISQSVRDLLPLLRAQRQISLAAHIYGKSYLITAGDTVRLPFEMQDVQIGDTIRLNRALFLNSRDFTLKPAAAQPMYASNPNETKRNAAEITNNATLGLELGSLVDQMTATAPHFIPHIAKNKHSYLDERLFVCRATVVGIESEPMRVKELTKRRQRHVKHVRSKHRYTVLRISELRVRSVEELEKGEID